MTRSSTLQKGLRIVAAWATLAAIVGCSWPFGQEEDTPPPVAPEANSDTTQGSDNAAGAQQANFTLAPGFTPDPSTTTGTAGGPVDASTLDQACAGFVPAAPQHTITLSQPITGLRVLVGSTEDTTLVVHLANGAYLCNDDAEGLNPIVEGDFPAGANQVFVGSYDQSVTPTYTVAVTTLKSVTATSLASEAAPPTPPGGTTHVQLSTGFMPDPETARGTAGGNVQASTFNDSCGGYVPAAPQHTLQLQTPFSNLRVLVNSQEDTTLVIRTPDGQYRCNDDSEGLDPIVQGNFPSGTYQVWVGSYDQNVQSPYVIGFSELSSTTAASLGN